MIRNSKECRLFTSYHVHSTRSDGADSIQSVTAAAPWHKLVELGISDHLVLAPPATGPVSWSIKPENLEDYVEEVLEAREDCQIPVKLGLEVDYFPAQVDVIRDLLAPYKFDYLIGSVHFVDGFPLDESPEAWESLSEREINQIYREYWRRIAAMAKTELFQLAAHLDLPKKFNFRPSEDQSEAISAALDAIAAANMTVELNTAGWGKPCQECYPSEEILRQAVSRDIPIVVTADAHRKTDLTQYYDRAFELLCSLY